MLRGTNATIRKDIMAVIDELGLVKNAPVDNYLLPKVDVDNDSGNIPVLGANNSLQVTNTERAADGSYQRGTWDFGADSYTCIVRGYEVTIDKISAMSNSKILDEELVSAEIALDRVVNSRIKRVIDSVFNTTTFTGTDSYLEVTHEWDDSTNAVPKSDVNTAASYITQKTGVKKKNLSLFCNETVMENALATDDINSNAKYTVAIDLKSMDEKAKILATALGIKEVVIVDSIGNDNGRGESASFSEMAGDGQALLCLRCPETNSFKIPGLGRQPSWSGLVRNTKGIITSKYINDVIVETYADSEKDKIVVRAKDARDEYVNSDYGFLLDNLETT